jgi:hypothetical protein
MAGFSIVSDTTDNIPSANNFIRADYRLFIPTHPWTWPNTTLLAQGPEITASPFRASMDHSPGGLSATGPFCVWG